jgi:2',3'-cyclic-nucleotide 2'-phosphodiesterase (5'-nucleotidase family)
MDSLAIDCGCPTLRVDAGDALQGTVTANITRGRAMVDALNHLGIAATALGDHDLEWSVDTLLRRISESRYAWLAANVFDSAGNHRPDWAQPYRMVQIGRFKIAIVGYITSDAKNNLKPELTAGLRFGDGALAIHDVLAEVRAQRPDLTVLLAHAGAACQDDVCTGEVIRLAEGVEPRTIDLLIVGHNHRTINSRVAGIPIVEPLSGGAEIVVADVVKTPAGGREIRAHLEPVTQGEVREEPSLVELVETYARRSEAIGSRVVASIKFPLTREGDQYRLGGLIAEARRNVLRADVGLVRNADITADLAGGPATYGQLFEVQSSQNGLVKVTLTGRRLREMLEHVLERGIPRAHVSGLSVRFDPRRPTGKRVQQIDFSSGRVRNDRTYTLAVDDFVANGGDGYTMLSGLPSENAGALDVDVLATYLRRLPQPVQVTGVVGFTSTRR